MNGLYIRALTRLVLGASSLFSAPRSQAPRPRPT